MRVLRSIDIIEKKEYVKANVDPQEYIKALKESNRKGVNVILARDIDEIYVNNYSPEWVVAWDGNIDKNHSSTFLLLSLILQSASQRMKVALQHFFLKQPSR